MLTAAVESSTAVGVTVALSAATLHMQVKLQATVSYRMICTSVASAACAHPHGALHAPMAHRTISMDVQATIPTRLGRATLIRAILMEGRGA